MQDRVPPLVARASFEEDERDLLDLARRLLAALKLHEGAVMLCPACDRVVGVDGPDHNHGDGCDLVALIREAEGTIG